MSKQLALVIDLNVCVGCHACVTSCKEWNAGGVAGPLSDLEPYGAEHDDQQLHDDEAADREPEHAALRA